MTDYLDDQTLVTSLFVGDEAAEKYFAEKYRRRFVFVVRQRGVPHEDCEDVAHDALLASISQLQRGLFRGESSLGTWLERILSGKIADYWRKQTRKESLSISEGEGDGETLNDRDGIVPSVQSDPLPRLMVDEALMRMPPRHRRVLLLNQMDGYTIEEISRRFGWPEGTVGRVLSEAKRMFIKLILGGEESRNL